MTFSSMWDNQYALNSQMSVWPWSDLVSYVIRHSKQNKKQTKVLEIGCGAGANISFFLEQGFEYYGIEGSKTIINKLKKKFPKIKNNLVIGDFTKDLIFDKKFDLIIDRSSLTHNSTLSIKNSINLAYEKMSNDSRYIGIDWFSTKHDEFKKNVKKVDVFTKTDFKKGQFAHVGPVHFSNKSHLLKLFEKFEIIILEHKIIVTEIPKKNRVAMWNFVAKKQIKN